MKSYLAILIMALMLPLGAFASITKPASTHEVWKQMKEHTDTTREGFEGYIYGPGGILAITIFLVIGIWHLISKQNPRTLIIAVVGSFMLMAIPKFTQGVFGAILP